MSNDAHDTVMPETRLEGETIVYFGPEPWEGMWRNRHQLMSRLAANNRVIYVEPAHNIRPALRRLFGAVRSAV